VILAYLAVRGLVGLFGLLPRAAALRLGMAGGIVWYLFDGKRRTMAARHMRRVLGVEGDQLRRAVREVFSSYGRYWAETFWVRERRIPEIDRTLTIEGLEHLEKAAAAGTGAVIIVPHLGNWEVAALAGPRAGIEIVAVAERLANPHITRWFTSLREAFGITIVLAGKGAIKQLGRAIDRGAAVGLLADRDLKGRGLEAEFFGEVTTLPTGPVVLAERSGVPLLSAVCYFTPGGHRLVIGPPIDLPPGDPAAGARMVAARLEQQIAVAPTQWHLLQPNWPSDREAR
jgi:lauroyl/myristoyl acyltransferase